MSRHRQFLVGLLVGSVGFLVVASSITSANATSEPDSIGVRLAEVPSDLADDPRASLYIVDHVAPGTRLERDLEVSSSSAAPVQVELYAAGASIANGVFAGDAGRTDHLRCPVSDLPPGMPPGDRAPQVPGSITDHLE